MTKGSGHRAARVVYHVPSMSRNLVLAVLLFFPGAAIGQSHEPPGGPRFSWSVGASVIGLVTHATPAQHGRDLTEAYLTQPNLSLHAATQWLRLTTTVNLEGLTLRAGELNAGTWGEGYIDRRHPHTYLHEAILSARTDARETQLSLAAGKGFAPFGSDDPMARPPVKFPANHHLAQLLERLVLIGAVRRGRFMVEAGIFNGDEPLNAKSLGQLDRFGDSWSARVTLFPVTAFELQASHARVESPEQPAGGGLDQRKWSVSLRHERRPEGDGHYFLIEWLRTGEYRDANEVLVLYSALGEASVTRGLWQAAFRIERTLRPEEERTDGIFRTPWPHIDEAAFGQTRWFITSVNVSRRLNFARLAVVPILEIGHQRPSPTTDPSLFEPETLYGSDRLWSVSFGARIAIGASHGRMGRYGVAVDVRGH